MTRMTIGDVVAIDVHVHLRDAAAREAAGETARQMARYAGRRYEIVPADEMAEEYRRRRMMAVVLNTTDETVTGRRGLPNDYVAKVVEANSDVLIGFGIVDPWMGRLAIEEVRRCADLGLKGIGEFNPARQHFYPNDPRFYPLWETIQELGLIVLFHTGMAAAGAGTPGGMGIKLKYTRPIPYLDDVAADFPELKIIGAHPSWPYDAENLAVARHKANYFMDLSGWAPKHFSQDLVNHAKSILSDKMLFGSDSGIVSVDRWMEEFNALPIPAASKQKIIRDNAVRLFGLE